MIDLYQLLEKQKTMEIVLDDNTVLYLAKMSDGSWNSSWHSNDHSKPVPKYVQYVNQAKSARLAVEAALQARYPE